MSKVKMVVAALGVMVFASGCYHNLANKLTIERRSGIGGVKQEQGLKVEGENGVAIHLDAEQRLVFSKVDKTKTTTTKNGNNAEGAILQICAEPSPDAITAFSSSFAKSLSGSYKDKIKTEHQIASALAKSSASIGLRTQSIQLMRDALYRTCEGYFSGAITKKEFYNLHEQFQDVLVGALAIEQLTGAVAAPAVVLGQGVTVDVGGNSSKVKSSSDSKQLNVTVHKQDASKVALAVQGIVDRVLLSRDIRHCLKRDIAVAEQLSELNTEQLKEFKAIYATKITGTSLWEATSKQNDEMCDAIKKRAEKP